jgi:hypothetical protein
MPAKIARLATRPPFWIPQVSVAVITAGRLAQTIMVLRRKVITRHLGKLRPRWYHHARVSSAMISNSIPSIISRIHATTILSDAAAPPSRPLSGSIVALVATAGRVLATDRGSGTRAHFSPEHPPGRQALSDFTDGGCLAVTIAGAVPASALSFLARI